MGCGVGSGPGNGLGSWWCSLGTCRVSPRGDSDKHRRGCDPRPGASSIKSPMGVGTLRRVVPRVRAIGSGGRSGRGRRSPRTEAHHTSGGPFSRPPHVRIGRRGTAISQTVRATPHDHRRRLRREATRPRKDATQSGLNMPDTLRTSSPRFHPSRCRLLAAPRCLRSGRCRESSRSLVQSLTRGGCLGLPAPLARCCRTRCVRRRSNAHRQPVARRPTLPLGRVGTRRVGPGVLSHRLAVISQRLPARPGLSAAASAGTRSNAGMA